MGALSSFGKPKPPQALPRGRDPPGGSFPFHFGPFCAMIARENARATSLKEDAMIRFENVHKTYASGQVKAVDDLNLEIENGKVFGFIGPNGAGKTTTIKLMTGILQPDAGRVLLEGIDMARNPLEAKRTFGYVPDSFEMYDRLTGMDYLRFLADVYGVSAARRREHIEKYLALFELEKAAYQQIRSYSHGMKQKLSIIGALIHGPSIWVLDEPMTGLDPRSMHVLKEEMKAHCQEGRSVFFSTHVLDVAERLCDEIGIIQHGKLIAKGTLEELKGGERDSTLEALFLELTQQEEA